VGMMVEMTARTGIGIVTVADLAEARAGERHGGCLVQTSRVQRSNWTTRPVTSLPEAFFGAELMPLGLAAAVISSVPGFASEEAIMHRRCGF